MLERLAALVSKRGTDSKQINEIESLKKQLLKFGDALDSVEQTISARDKEEVENLEKEKIEQLKGGKKKDQTKTDDSTDIKLSYKEVSEEFYYQNYKESLNCL